MKTVSVFLLLLIIFFRALSQDFVYEGPARAEVRSFWTNAMGIPRTGKIAEGVAILEAKIKEVKQKDPAYNTDKMQVEINKWKAKAGSSSSDKPSSQEVGSLSPTQRAIMADKLLRKLFDEVNLNVDARDLPVIQIRFKEYKDMVQQYLTLNTTPKESDIRRTKTIIEKHVYSTNKDITNIEAAKKQVTDSKAAEVNYYIGQYNLLYWEAAAKIFPTESTYTDQYKIVSDFVAKNGGLEEANLDVDKNNSEKIKNTKLPVSTVKDTKLEKILTDGFNAKYGSSNKVVALKAVLVQNGWTTLRNQVTGVIIGRERSAKLAYKGSDGKCYLLNDYIFIHEEYIGGAFKNTKAVFNGLFGSEMLCQNVQ